MFQIPLSGEGNQNWLQPHMAYAQSQNFESVMSPDFQAKIQGYTEDELKQKIEKLYQTAPDETFMLKALGYELWKRGGQDRKPSFIDSWEKQIADYQNPDKKKGEDSTLEKNTSWFNTIKQAMDNPTEGLASTFKAFGWDGTSKWFSDLIKQDENYQNAFESFLNGNGFREGFDVTELPRATLEQSGDLVTSILTRTVGLGVGAGIGALIGGPAGLAMGATIGAISAPAGFAFVRHLGPIVWERAKNDGRQFPNREDWAWAIGTSAGIGVMESIGVNYGVGIANFIRKMFTEGLTEGLQSFTEQVGTTLQTEKGLNVELKQILAEATLGASSRGAVDATVYTAKNVATLGQSGANARSAKEFREDQDHFKSQVRVGQLFEQEVNSLKKAQKFEKGFVGENRVFKNLRQKVKNQYLDTIRALVDNGSLDPKEGAELKKLTSFAFNTQRAVGDEEFANALNVLENTSLSDDAKNTLINSLRDLDNVSEASVAKRNRGFFQEILTSGGRMIGTGAPITAVGPAGALASIGGYTVGGKIGGSIGAGIDKLTGLHTPVVLKRYAKKRAYLESQGVDFGNTLGDLTKLANEAHQGKKFINKAKILQIIADGRARAERRAKNNEGLGGYDFKIFNEVGLKPAEVDKALEILLAKGEISESTVDKFYNDPNLFMVNDDGVRSKEGLNLLDKLKGLMLENGLADFTDLEITYEPNQGPVRKEGERSIVGDGIPKYPNDKFNLALSNMGSLETDPDIGPAPPLGGAEAGANLGGNVPPLGGYNDLQNEPIGSKVEPVSRKAFFTNHAGYSADLKERASQIKNKLAYEASARGKQERYTNAVNNIMNTEGIRPDVKSYLGSTLSPIVDFPDYKSAKSLADVLVANLDANERALVLPHLNQILAEKKGAPKGTLDNQFDGIKPNANCDLSKILGKKGPR